MKRGSFGFDSLGVALLGLAGFLAVSFVATGALRLPEPMNQSAAQASAAWAAWAMVWTSFVGTGIGLASLFLIYHTLQAARVSAAAAQSIVAETRDIGIRQIRAYALINAAYLEISDAIFRIVLSVANSGHSPAMRVTLSAQIYYEVRVNGSYEIVLDATHALELDDIAGNHDDRVSINIPMQIQPQHAMAINSNQARVRIVGTLQYHTIFGRERSAGDYSFVTVGSPGALGGSLKQLRMFRRSSIAE